MLLKTVSLLRCPQLADRSVSRQGRKTAMCAGELRLQQSVASHLNEIANGILECTQCGEYYPILSGVAVVVPDVRYYLLSHAKGISKFVKDEFIPKAIRKEYLEVKAEIFAAASEHIEDDLESERVNSLYLMNHYLRVDQTPRDQAWWKPKNSDHSALIETLVEQYWDNGPFSVIQDWISELPEAKKYSVVELGCGVGGISRVLAPHVNSYLGVDSSFASVLLARHLNLGISHPQIEALKVPGDLIQGITSQAVKIEAHAHFNLDVKTNSDFSGDFIVGDIDTVPVQAGAWDVSIALNSIDMLDEPASLPRAQSELLKTDGFAIQSCPYIWHEKVAKHLKANLPKDLKNRTEPVTSAEVVEWLYQKNGFKVEKVLAHVPWLFFKHFRQIELYSVHLFLVRKSA